jgi:hypothetical protein
MYVLRNIEERSCNHCCSGKVMISVYLFVALGIRQAMRMLQTVVCDLPRST